MNVIGLGAGRYVEIQGTAEGAPFDRTMLTRLLDLADHGIAQLIQAQAQAVKG
ncbi:Ribonuclease PH [compost metagenome]